MCSAQVFGNDVAINFAGSGGNLQLNVNKPLLAHAFLQSARLLADAVRSFDLHAMHGLDVDRSRIEQNVERSLMLVTALTPHIGYDKAAAIAKRAHAENETLRQAAVGLGYVTTEQFDAWVRVEDMIGAESNVT